MSLASPTRRLSAPSHVLARGLDGETILLNLDSACYFGLDAIGTHFWRTLCDAASVDAARQALLAAYDVDAERLRRDLEHFIDTLAQHGLVDIHFDATSNASLSNAR